MQIKLICVHPADDILLTDCIGRSVKEAAILSHREKVNFWSQNWNVINFRDGFFLNIILSGHNTT